MSLSAKCQTKEYEEELLKDALKNYFSSSTPLSDAHPIQIRHKSPFLYSKTSKHDARGDAMSLALKNMIQRNFPLWAAHIIANNFVDAFADKLQTNKTPFSNYYQAIEANSWSRQVIECFENYIRELSQGVRELPVMPEGWNILPISFSAERNKKPKMEDRHIILPSLEVVAPQENKKFANKDGFFAIFDGHHGPECAAYASAHFVECLFESMDESDSTDMEKVLKDAFEKMDKRITAVCRNENIKSGTTASCVYLKGNETAYLAWCGDSSIGVLNNNSVETISIPHKPEDPEERRRIEEAGGMVVNINGVPRLNGVLNLSRSLGDIRAKPMVSPEPDVLAYPLTDDDQIIFLASDGVWDNLEAEEIFEAVKTFFADNCSKDYKLLTEFIVQKAKEAGASDNLTLICVFIKPLDEIWKKFAPS